MTDNLSEWRAPEATLGNLLQQAVAQLRQAGRGEAARLEAELLLAHVLGQPRSHLLVHAEDTPDAGVAPRYRALLERATEGVPLAYLIGQREFWSLRLGVSADVLIPRPETELAVERCLALVSATGALPPGPAAPRPRVCDLGTGSGAIALALASERSAWQIMATDLSAAALHVARANAARLGLANVEFLQGSWLEPLGGRMFELIVSNPPYVRVQDPALSALRHEPTLALTAGPTGLEALQHLIGAARAHLTRGGWLVLEHGADQGAAVTSALVEAGYARVRCHRDLTGHDRVSEGQRP